MHLWRKIRLILLDSFSPA